MKICFIVDGRSVIALNWIQYFIEQGHEIHIVSSFPCCEKRFPQASWYQVPIAFSKRVKLIESPNSKTSSLNKVVIRYRSGFLEEIGRKMLYTVIPIDILRNRKKLKRILQDIQPDLVHAMRIPFEGIFAALTLLNNPTPLLLSVWGNDFTLHANRFPTTSYFTKKAMRRADALLADCQRDITLASKYCFRKSKPSLFVPGSGGVNPKTFYPSKEDNSWRQKLNISSHTKVIFNPRGFRICVRSDTFFKSISYVLEQHPEVVFVVVAMAGNNIAESWQKKIGNRLQILPKISQEKLASLFRISTIVTSISEHDGTPNSLLEAMASGAFPIAGDIASIREWIHHGFNGLLVDPSSPESLGNAISQALNDEQLRKKARHYNFDLIQEKAEYRRCMAKAEEFYQKLIGNFS